MTTDQQVAGRSSRTRRANTAWEALLAAQVALMRSFAGEDVWAPVSMREYDVLYTLRKGPEHGLRLRDLNEGVLLSQPSLSRMVDRLADRGLVVRDSDDNDGRAVRIRLTDHGRAVQREVGRRHATSVAAHVATRLDDDEMAELERLCRALVERREEKAL